MGLVGTRIYKGALFLAVLHIQHIFTATTVHQVDLSTWRQASHDVITTLKILLTDAAWF